MHLCSHMHARSSLRLFQLPTYKAQGRLFKIFKAAECSAPGMHGSSTGVQAVIALQALGMFWSICVPREFGSVLCHHDVWQISSFVPVNELKAAGSWRSTKHLGMSATPAMASCTLAAFQQRPRAIMGTSARSAPLGSSTSACALPHRRLAWTYCRDGCLQSTLHASWRQTGPWQGTARSWHPAHNDSP